jgi:HK97 family phage prohead protease
MLLRKTIKLSEVNLKISDDSGSFEGYASVFNGVDSYGDTIVKGAFIDTLAEGMPKMFFNHDWTMPIGKYTVVEEDSTGLFVKGELTPGISLSADVRAAMLHGTLDGLSVGGMVKKSDYTETETGRTITKWTRLMEISPVAFPADESARVDMATVKGLDFGSLLPECKTERQLEHLLRDAGMSKTDAMAVLSRARSIFSGRDVPEDEMQSVLIRINNLFGETK